jgi:hypothetical protein
LDPDRNGSRTENVDSQKGCAAEASLPIVPLLPQLSSIQMTSAEELNVAVARSLEDEVILEDCTDSERGRVTIAESRDEPPRVIKRLSIASYRSPGLWIAADDPTGRLLHILVDSLSVTAEGVVKRLGGSHMGNRGKELVSKMIEEVDSCLWEMIVTMTGPSVDYCVRQLESRLEELEELLQRANKQERHGMDRWNSGSSSGYETGSEEGETSDSTQKTLKAAERAELIAAKLRDQEAAERAELIAAKLRDQEAAERAELIAAKLRDQEAAEYAELIAAKLRYQEAAKLVELAAARCRVQKAAEPVELAAVRRRKQREADEDRERRRDQEAADERLRIREQQQLADEAADERLRDREQQRAADECLRDREIGRAHV